MWTSDGTYLGVLQNVSSEFVLNQDINSLGPASIRITVAASGDTAYLPVEAITTEDEEPITTEADVVITTEGAPPNFGVERSMIRNGNLITITEVSDYHPNGLIVFSGKVTRWKVNFGTNDDMMLTAISRSLDMINHLVRADEVNSFTQTNSSASYPVFLGTSPTTEQKFAYQIGVNTTGLTNISGVALKLGPQDPLNLPTVTVRIFNLYAGEVPLSGEVPNLNKMNNPFMALGEASRTLIFATDEDYEFTFPIPIPIHPNGSYTVEVESTGVSGTGTKVWYTSSDLYPSGVINSYDNSTGTPQWNAGPTSGEAYLRIYSIPPTTRVVFQNFEPTVMLKDVLENYTVEGGIVTYTEDSIVATDKIVDEYTFSVNTIDEALDATLDMSPSGYYYTIDPGTHVLTFKRISATADHMIMFKKHIENLNLESTIENIKNEVYFTGGDQGGGTNLFIRRVNQTSIDNFGTSIDRIGDSRVNTSGAGIQITQNYLDRNDDEAYETTVTILDTTTDITQYKPGQTVGFKGFGNMVDDLILPIVRISRPFDKVELSLGVLPLRKSKLLNDTQEAILALQTIANPDEPS